MDNFKVEERRQVYIEANDFRAIIIGINTDARKEYEKIIEEGREAGVTNIYDKSLSYWARLKELEEFITVTHVMNGIVNKYSEIITLRDKKTKGEH